MNKHETRKSQQTEARERLGETSDEYSHRSSDHDTLRDENAGEEAQRQISDVANTAPGGMGETGPRRDKGFADDSIRRDR